MRVLLLLPQQEGEGESRSVVEALLGGRLLLLLWLWGVKKYDKVRPAYISPAYKSHKHLRAQTGREGPRPRVDSPVPGFFGLVVFGCWFVLYS